MTATAVLRQARRDDLAAIWRVRYSVHENKLTSRVTDEDVLTQIETTGRGWVIEAAGVVVAFAIGVRTDGNVSALFVDPAHERRGFGRRLHDTMVAWLWAQGLPRLWLTTGPGTRAQRFYQAAGWRAVGTTQHGEIRFELQRPEAAA